MKKGINLERNYWVDAGGRRYEVEEMKSSHLINTVLYLERRADDLKRNHDVDLLDDDKNLEATVQLIALYTGEYVKKDDLIKEMWKIDSNEWLKSTITYQMLLKEVEERGLTEYLDMLHERAE